MQLLIKEKWDLVLEGGYKSNQIKSIQECAMHMIFSYENLGLSTKAEYKCSYQSICLEPNCMVPIG